MWITIIILIYKMTKKYLKIPKIKINIDNIKIL